MTSDTPATNQSILTRAFEDIDSDQVRAWVLPRTQKTSTTYSNPELKQKIFDILTDDRRIPYVTRHGDYYYNLWTDSDHPRGIWRRCSPESYLAGAPEWTTLIDIDELGTAEKESWVWKGVAVYHPSYDRALVRLSRGGGDSVTIREFDLTTCTFVPEEEHPFTIPDAKTTAVWIDRDTILVCTDTGKETMTVSGYPSQVRRWRRGQKLIEAELLFAGHHSDVVIGGYADTTEGFERIFVNRSIDFFHDETFVETDAGMQIIEVPDDCRVMVHREWLILLPRTDFAGIPGGGAGITNFDDWMAGIKPTPTVVFTPTAHCSLQGVTMTKNYLIIETLEDVISHLSVSAFTDPTRKRTVSLPPMCSAGVTSTSDKCGDEFFFNASSFTTPSTLYRVDLAEEQSADTATPIEPTVLRQLPTLFDSSGMTTRQHWVTSADGTKVPYFITGRFGDEEEPVAKPVLVTAYGGFEVSRTPSYTPITGLSWLAGDRYLVLANLRGGGEFGPEWHQQTLTRNRPKIYEDYRAVLHDIVARGYTTVPQLAIRGGSNGGLLTAVAVTRYPELVGAAVVQVPLTDMLRYTKWLAGASWASEYGDPDDPEDRKVLASYSPMEHVVDHQERPYPPALVTTSTRDDRVHPVHARLFAHALEEHHQPVDYLENPEGGHAGAADLVQSAWIESVIYTWLDRQTRGQRNTHG